ncbi:NAD(P)-binding domain-containing protein [Microbacteriaceae bacterium VKM Ac-2855]|nr:NAD(P)-binding domain-containing protein [Microbacteriaceae bacterium VKM Ac-2855]
MTAPLGIIGAGAIGSTLARLAIAADLDVIIGNSRGPETLTELVEQFGPRARAATVAEVAEAADIIITAIPLIAASALPAEALAGKIVVDTTNYYPERDGQIAVLDSNESTASEFVQSYLLESFVVKGFNNITFASLGNGARAAGDPERNTLPIAGEDAGAKARVAELFNTLGYDALDIGGLADSWRSEPGTPIYCDPYMPAWPTEKLPFDELLAWLLSAPVIPMPKDRAQRLLSGAVRGTAGGYFPATV